jgi:hypothetical protein
MTRTSNNGLALAVGLFAAAAAGAGAAQESPAERYARTLADAEVTARYNTYVEEQVRSQEQQIAALEEQIAQLDTTAVDIQPLLQRMFDDLVQFVASDLPFFEEERDTRVERLRELIGRVDASPSEKFRRLLEAYQIEMEYGRTMSTYRQTLADGREADILRLGRIALMYRTIEDEETGYWDHERKEWVRDQSAARSIEDALGIAKEERAPDLIVVPVPAPQGGRS